MAGAGPSVSYIPGPAGSGIPRKGSLASPSSTSTPFAPFAAAPRVVSSPMPSNSSIGSSGSSIPKFRALRSMLPFGPKQSATAHAPTSPSAPPSSMPTRGTLMHRRSSSSIPASSSTQISPLPPPLPLPVSDDEGMGGPDRRTRAFLTLGPRASLAAALARAGVVDRTRPPPPTASKSILSGLQDAENTLVITRARSEDLGAGWRAGADVIKQPRPSVDVVNSSGGGTQTTSKNTMNSGLLLHEDHFKKSSLAVASADSYARSLEDLSRKPVSHAAAFSSRDFLPPIAVPPPLTLSPGPERRGQTDPLNTKSQTGLTDKTTESGDSLHVPPENTQSPEVEVLRRPLSSISPGELSTIAESERSRDLEFSLSVIEASVSASSSAAADTPPSIALARHLPPLDTSVEGLAPVSHRVGTDQPSELHKGNIQGNRTPISGRGVDDGGNMHLLSDLARSVHARGRTLLAGRSEGSQLSNGGTSSATFSPGSLLSPWSAFESSTSTSSRSRPASSSASSSVSPVEEEHIRRGDAGVGSSERSEQVASNRLSARWDAGLAELQRAISEPASSGSAYSEGREEADADIDTEDMEEEPPSFNLGALDPDLAELLRASVNVNVSREPDKLPDDVRRPHGMGGMMNANTDRGDIDDVTLSVKRGDDRQVEAMLYPPPPGPDPLKREASRAPSPSTSIKSSDLPEGSRRSSTEAKRDSHADGRGSQSSQRRTLGTQSSPARRTRSRPASLALSAASDSGRRGSLEIRGESIDDTRTLAQPMSPAEIGYRRGSRSPYAQGGSIEDLPLSFMTAGRRPALARSYSALGPSEFGEQRRYARDADGPLTGGRSRPRLCATPARPSTALGATGSQRVASDGATAPRRPGSASGFRFGTGLRSAGTGPSLERRDVHTSMSMASPHDARSTTPTRARSALGDSLSLTYSARRYGNGYGHGERERPGTALGTGGTGTSNSSLLATPFRTRKRSASAAGPDWTGRRTARAFADARLQEQTPTGSGFSRGSFESAGGRTIREFATSRGEPWLAADTFGPPRGVSPATTTTTGRTGTSMSSLGTMRRSESTATSLSAGGSPSPPSYLHLGQGRDGAVADSEAALAALRSKHAVEIEALVGALADSQRSARDLRSENVRLHARVQILEHEVASLQASGIPSAEPVRRREREAAGAYLGHAHSRSGSMEAMRSARVTPYLRDTRSRAEDVDLTALATSAGDFLREMADWEKKRGRGGFENGRAVPDYLAPDHGRKRASTVSSSFPPLPSNMSLLLHDEDAGESMLAGSGAESAEQTGRASHHAHPSVSSAGSAEKSALSATSQSVLSLPGSSSSLVLRPEHEKHLRDMISLDFSSLDIESD